MGAQVDTLMAMSRNAADEGNMTLAESLMDEAENLLITMTWEGVAS